MSATWRLIPYSQMSGAMNMAVDLLLLEKADSSPPVLRLYGFSPACMSLGFSQNLPDETIRRIKDKGFDIVRRPTGGRAVLHLNDLTYSFVASQKGTGDHGILESSVSAAYKQICAGLQRAFEILGLKAELGASSSAYRHLADCFLATTNADLHFAGRKLAGSAQLRRRSSVLQHGSIPLNLDQNLMAELLGISRDENVDRHANLFDLLGRNCSMDELEKAIKSGFESTFMIEFQNQPLSESEIAQALTDSANAS